MAKLFMVFCGCDSDSFRFELDATNGNGMEEYSGVEGTMTLDSLKLIQEDGPDFPFVHGVCVSKIKTHYVRDGDYYSVIFDPAAVRWILFFPAVRWGCEYFPETETIDPSGSDVFFSFRSAISSATDGKPIRVVPYLEKLNLLSPQPGDELALVRVKNPRQSWRKRGYSVLIPPQSVLEVETVSGSEVYVPDKKPSEHTEYTVEIIV
jgi:hypothetical protein